MTSNPSSFEPSIAMIERAPVDRLSIQSLENYSREYLQPALGEVNQRMANIEGKIVGMWQAKDEAHEAIRQSIERMSDNIRDMRESNEEKLTKIVEQTTKTNGRVTQLERKEDLNKIMRTVLWSVGSLILLGVVGAWLRSVLIPS